MSESYQDQEHVQGVIRRIIRTERFGLLDENCEAPEPEFSNELEKRWQQCQNWFTQEIANDGLCLCLNLDLDAWNERKILSLNQKLHCWPKNRAIILHSKSLDKALSAAFYLSDQKFANLILLKKVEIKA